MSEYSNLIEDIVSVQPMTDSNNNIFKFKYISHEEHVKEETELNNNILINTLLDKENINCEECDIKLNIIECEISYYKSPEYTWASLCGRAGWLFKCPFCKNEVKFKLTTMN